jgi:hypothetical protein
MIKNALKYERPTVVDHGSLAELTAALDVGGPADTHVFHPPGHSCPTSGAPSKGCK